MNSFAIGVDIGGTRTKAGLVNIITGEVLHTIVQPTKTRNEPAFVAGLGSAITELNTIAANRGHTIEGVGFGVPSFVYGNGKVDSTYGFLEFMEDYPLADIVRKQFELPCRVENDARVVGLGEALYGQGKDFERVLVLTLGTGLGFGWVVKGRFPDEYPYAHMGGHMSISQNGGTCYCGKTGCLEALVSSKGIVNAANNINWQQKYPAIPINAEAIFMAAENGNRDAIEIVRQLVEHLRTGLHNYINLYAPEIIVLGGGIAKGLIPFADQIITADFLKPFKNYKVQLAISVLEERAGIAGAAALFR
jgi:glucokinase